MRDSTFKYWGKRIGIGLLIFIILAVAATFYIRENGEKIVRNGIINYAEKHNGKASIVDVKFKFENNFRDLSVNIGDFQLNTLDTVTNQYKELNFNSLHATISMKNWMARRVVFKDIFVDSLFFKSKIANGNPVEFYLSEPDNKEENDLKKILKRFDEKGSIIQLKNSEFDIADEVKNKRYIFQVKEFSGNFSKPEGDDFFSGQILLDAFIGQLGFNLAKGAYANDIALKSEMDVVFDEEKQNIAVAPHALHLDDEVFETTMNFAKEDTWNYHFQFRNNETNVAYAKEKILNDSIRAKVSFLHFEQPISTYLDLKGNFLYGNNPVAEATFSTEENTANLNDQYLISDFNVQGKFSNRKFDYEKNEKVSLKDFSLKVDTLTGSLNNLPLLITNTTFESDVDTEGLMLAKIETKGDLSALRKMFSNIPVSIKSGDFDVSQSLKAEVRNGQFHLQDIQGNLDMQNALVQLTSLKNEVNIPSMELSLHNNTATIQNSRILLHNQQPVHISGTVHNFQNAFNGSRNGVLTDLLIETQRISIDDLLNEMIQKKQEKDKKAFTFPGILDANSVLALQTESVIWNGKEFKNVDANILIREGEAIHLNQTKLNYNSIHALLNGDVQIKSINDTLSIFQANMNVSANGNTSDVTTLANLKDWQLFGGEFQLNTTIQGNLNNQQDLLAKSDGEFTLINTNLESSNLKTPITINNLEANFSKNSATITNSDFYFHSGNSAKISGSILGLSNLIQTGGHIHTDVSVESNQLDLNDLLPGETGTQEEKINTNRERKEAIFAISSALEKYHPSVSVDVKKFINGRHSFHNVNASLVMEEPNAFLLEQLNLDYLDSKVTGNGRLELMDVQRRDSTFQAVGTDLEIEVQGKTNDFNYIFQDKDFAFSQGDYSVLADIKGEIANMNDLAESATIELLVLNDEVTNQKTGVSLPVDSLYLTVVGNVADLKTLEIPINNKDEIYFSGEVDEFLSLFDTDQSRNPTAELEVEADYINVQEFLRKFELNITDTSANQKDTTKKLTRSGFKDFLLTTLQKYNPSVHLDIAQANYRSIIFDSIHAEAALQENSIFKVQNTGFQFPGGLIEVNTEVDLGKTESTPFETQMLAKNVVIEELIDDSKMLGLPDLEIGGELFGNLSIDADISGAFDEYDRLQVDDLRGDVDLVLKELEMVDFQPLIDKVKILSKDRFRDLEFAPIIIRLNLDEGKYVVEQTEVESNAFQLFLEGIFKENDIMEIWFSVPLKNIWKPDLTEAPKKTGFHLAGNKIYLVYVKEDGEDPSVKVRLSNRQLYKQKGILDQFKIDKRKGRKLRREQRRNEQKS